MKLTTRSELITLFQEHSVTPLKQLGQNFLVDENMLLKIVECAGVKQEDHCLEVGPGAGALTQQLATCCEKVVAVEVDRGMVELLKTTLAGYDNVEVISGDILKVDLEQIIAEKLGTPFKVVANLPYYICSAVIMRLARLAGLTSMSLLLQKEVAERMVAKPGGKDYGILSIAVQYYFQPEIVLNVPATCFYPRPKVDSSVIRMERFMDNAPKARNDTTFFQVVKAAFAHRRKTILNNLSAFVGRERAKELLLSAGIAENRRAEQLSISDFIILADSIE